MSQIFYANKKLFILHKKDLNLTEPMKFNS